MGAIKQAAANNKELAKQPSANEQFKGLLKANWGRIASVAPKHMNQERMFQLALSTYNQTPELAQCSPASVLGCLMKCSSLGLEPSAVDGLGRAYILPFFNNKTKQKEATFILGYRGMIALARQSGEIKDISARAVHEGDVFEYEYGLDEKLRHVPSTEPLEGRALTHVYMVAHFKDGGHYIDVMTKDEVDAIRKRSKAGSSSYSPWSTDYESMALKTVIRRAFKYLPVSVESQTAATTDETTPTVVDADGVTVFQGDTYDDAEQVEAEVVEPIQDNSAVKAAPVVSVNTTTGEVIE